MFTFDNLKELLSNKEPDSVFRAVNRIPEEELRNALALLIIQYHKSIEVERAVAKNTSSDH